MMHSSGLSAVAGYVAGTVVVLMWGTETPEHQGHVLAERAAQREAGFVGESSDIDVLSSSETGHTRRYQLHMDIREGRDGEGIKSKLIVRDPADDGRLVLEVISHGTAAWGGTQWLRRGNDNGFAPVTHEMRPLAVAHTQLCLEDIEIKSANAFHYALEAEPVLDGRPTYRLSRSSLAEHSRYSREVVWLDRQMLTPLRIDYFDHRDRHLKTARFSDFRAFGKHTRAGRVVIENKQSGETTRLTWTRRDLGVSLPGEAFLPPTATPRTTSKTSLRSP